ncbi:2-C-methyl-D-erythritol 2,4-cyclodiphosphate synthase [Proteinivorax hydrogeniformans]|uniref:2-C-methyl-D-erythritol 2,4-cyclodiphosphate synthase n=1 Tax=Proteinivorax hydrogeniformans TaxID=1826727 RepID=A0AAU8HTR6_9FIRM
MKIGIGYDVHKLVNDRKLIVGGVDIPFEKGLAGHSDSDVLIHAIMDSILGPLGLGDIGTLFPDTDQKFKDIDSMVLLKEVKNKLKERSIKIGNIDCVIMAQRPKMAPHIKKMRMNIANVLCIDESQITIKATTTEGLGFIGREEGIAAQAVSLFYCQNNAELV